MEAVEFLCVGEYVKWTSVSTQINLMRYSSHYLAFFIQSFSRSKEFTRSIFVHPSNLEFLCMSICEVCVTSSYYTEWVHVWYQFCRCSYDDVVDFVVTIYWEEESRVWCDFSVSSQYRCWALYVLYVHAGDFERLWDIIYSMVLVIKNDSSDLYGMLNLSSTIESESLSVTAVVMDDSGRPSWWPNDYSRTTLGRVDFAQDSICCCWVSIFSIFLAISPPIKLL